MAWMSRGAGPPSPNGLATEEGRWTKLRSGASNTTDTCSPTRWRRASSASSAATPPPAITTRGRWRSDMSGLLELVGGDESLERRLRAARHDDHGAGGPVDEPARDAAAHDAPERSVAAGPADEHVDVVAELLERCGRAAHEHRAAAR